LTQHGSRAWCAVGQYCWPMRESATGRTAIVTGAGRGIGRHIAQSFVQAGFRVVVNDIDQKRLEGVRAAIAAGGADVMSTLADVRDESDVRRLMDAAHERFGQIEVLVNNAAVVAHRSLCVRRDQARGASLHSFHGRRGARGGRYALCSSSRLSEPLAPRTPRSRCSGRILVQSRSAIVSCWPRRRGWN
jgi:hypothetical protein